MHTHPGYENLLREGGYLWERPKDAVSTVPHVILPVSKLHSTGYFWSPVDNPSLMRTIAYELYDMLVSKGVLYDKLSIIVGPERETAPLVTLLTLCIQEHGRAQRQVKMCLTQKREEGTNNEHQRMTEQCSTSLPNSGQILVVENAVATGSTAIHTVEAIQRHADQIGTPIEILPVIGCILNRTSRQSIQIGERTFKLVAYLNRRFSDWPADQCPLCRAGSPAVDPREDWAKLSPIA
ncbi:hypothetical protein JXA59_02460 [Patescibacteria group bacterium]|nr:hypothetical protein [Patescibacteria group bacterium]